MKGIHTETADTRIGICEIDFADLFHGLFLLWAKHRLHKLLRHRRCQPLETIHLIERAADSAFGSDSYCDMYIGCMILFCDRKKCVH